MTPALPAPRPPRRCLKHHHWLASCSDCRAAHQPAKAAR